MADNKISYESFKKKTALSGNKGKKFDDTKPSDKTPDQLQWWDKASDSDSLDSLKSLTALLSTNLLSRLARYRIESRLYGVVDLFANTQRSYNQSYHNSLSVPERLSYNVVQQNVDTLVSRLSKSRPRAKFLTNLGTFKAQKAAKKLSFFTDGIFAESDVYSISRQILRDSLTFGDGIIHAFEENKRIKLERVLPYEILVDEFECISGQPSHMYRIKLVDRSALMKLYPEYAEKIKNSQSLFTTNIHQSSQISDQIEILEGWYIGEEGKHIIAVPDCMLLKEDWIDKEFPFARLQWTKPFSGFWSQSLAEQLKPTQIELNKLLAVLQRSYHLAGSYKILIQNGSQIPDQTFNNNIGTLIKYTGAKPEYITPPIVPPEMYRQVETLIERSRQLAGISGLSATSQKPAGLNSGAALREFSDIESARFTAFSQDFEKVFVDIAKICVDLATDIAEKDGSYPVNVSGNKKLTKVDIKEIALNKEDYTVCTFPASSLPNEPAGRIAALDDLVQRGLIDPIEQRALLNFPDIEANSQLSTAQFDYLTDILEKMIEEGIYTAPEKDDNLLLARKLCLQYFSLAKSLDTPEENIDLLRQFIRDLDTLETPPVQIPQLPAPELGAMLAPAETAQLSLPAGRAPMPNLPQMPMPTGLA